MEEKFAKQGKSLPELYDLVHYITRPVIDIKEVIEMYDVWAEQYDKVRLVSTLMYKERFK